jgi:hypothetical protein
MNWEHILDSYLINLTDDYTGYQYYNICKNAALVNEDGKILASTKYFNVNI